MLWEQCIDEVYARQGKRQNSRPTECKICPVREPTRYSRLQAVSFQSYISHNFLRVCLSLFLPALSPSSYPLSCSLVIINQSISPLFLLHLLPNPLSYSESLWAWKKHSILQVTISNGAHRSHKEVVRLNNILYAVLKKGRHISIPLGMYNSAAWKGEEEVVGSRSGSAEYEAWNVYCGRGTIILLREGDHCNFNARTNTQEQSTYA